jgi:hypothetical protein
MFELTDVALLQSSRRRQQLFREAADRAQASRARAGKGLLRQAAQASAILHDEARIWRDRVPQARQLLAEFRSAATGSFVSQVRKALALRGKELLEGWEGEWSCIFANEFAGTGVSVAIYAATRP